VPLEKLADLVGGPTTSNNVNPVEDVVEEEVVGIDIKESPLESCLRWLIAHIEQLSKGDSLMSIPTTSSSTTSSTGLTLLEVVGPPTSR